MTRRPVKVAQGLEDRSSPFREVKAAAGPLHDEAWFKQESERKARRAAKLARRKQRTKKASGKPLERVVVVGKPKPAKPQKKVRLTARQRYDAYLRSPRWQEVRQAYFAQHEKACTGQGPHGGPIQLHHKSYRNLYNELFAMEDLQALCEQCHKRLHARRRE